MILKIMEKDEQIQTQIIENDIVSDFDYIKLINALYNKEEVKLSFENIDDLQKQKIEEIFDSISKTINKEEQKDE